MQEIDEERFSVLQSQLDRATLDMLRSVYPPGTPVEIIRACGLKEGTRAVAKHVNIDGTVVIRLEDGTERELRHGKESVRAVIEKGCLLRKKEWSTGGCEGWTCEGCGWDAEESRKRLNEIHEGKLIRTEDGTRRLKIQRTNQTLPAKTD